MQRRTLATSFGSIAMLLFAGSCATTNQTVKETPTKVVRTYYIFREQPTVKFRSPLPSLQIASREWHYSDGRLELVPGFRLWDFNGDGSPDFVEKLNENGDVDLTAADYNFDGQADVVHNADQPPSLPPEQEGPQPNAPPPKSPPRNELE